MAAVLYGPGLEGRSRITGHFKSYNPFFLADTLGKESLNAVRYWFDCGDDDFLSGTNALFHVKLKEMGVRHEFRMRDGRHSWPYWRSGLKDALRFIGQSFHQF